MTSKQPYPEEFKIEAVKQITERGHRVADVSTRIGVSQHSLYKWIKAYAVPAPERLTLPLFRVVLNPRFTRPFYAVPRTSAARIASG